MPKSEVNALTLVGVLIALGLSGTIVPGLSIYAQAVAAVILLALLFAYDHEGYRSTGQCFAFAGVAGACVSVIGCDILQLAGIPVAHGLAFTLSAVPQAQTQPAPFPWAPILWLAATLILWAIDMSRMQKRFAMQAYAAPQPAPVVMQPPLREQPAPMQQPAPIQQPVAPPAPPAPAPTPRPASNVTSLFSQAPIERRPEPVTYAPPTPPPAEAPPPPPVPAIPVAPPPAQQLAVPRGSGKPATIYLNLVGEGLAVMRSVQAEHVGKDYYLIVEPMPPGETWEFTTGQVVRCQKRNLSSGKGLVAVEEAPRAS